MANDWKSVPVSELCEKIIDCVNKTAPTADTSTPYKMIRTTNVRDGWVDTNSVKCVTDEVFRKWTRRGVPQYGDIILTREAPLGAVGLIRSKEHVFLGQRLVMYRADAQKLDNRFLLYSLMSDYLQGQIRALGSGATVEHMRVPDCEKLIVKVPSLEKQRKIASILSAYDDLIENNTRRIRILEEMAQSLYREWFVHFRFPGHENVKLVDSPLGKIPKGWEIHRLGDLAHETRRSIDPDQIDPKTPYIGLEHLPRKSIALSEWGTADQVKSTKLAFTKGEILFGKIRPYFHKVGVAPVDGVCSSDIIVISTKDPEFYSIVLACVSSEEFVSHATKTSQGTKMPRANWKVLLNYPLLVPPDSIKSKFNSFMENIVRQLDKSIFRNNNLRHTRNLLLPRLIAGEVLSKKDDK
ncbi:MAG: restriction endonuclease subunit S [Thermoleophilia bacterium]